MTFTYAQNNSGKESVLIHLRHGPENPTVAALTFLHDKTVVEEGHAITLFLAGDGVQAIRTGVVENLNCPGTGSPNDHIEVLMAAGCSFYLSVMSCKSRG